MDRMRTDRIDRINRSDRKRETMITGTLREERGKGKEQGAEASCP
jgi:hypothetical protein